MLEAAEQYMGHAHLAYNPSYSACFFYPKQYFSLTKNQPTLFFSRLIIPAERLHEHTTPSSTHNCTISPKKKTARRRVVARCEEFNHNKELAGG
jgi:hypothetical protein